MKKIIIPIGNHCWVAYNLKALGFRKQAYPFDWITSQPVDLFRLFFDIITSENVFEFINIFFNMDENEIIHMKYNNQYYFKNIKYNITFPHDDLSDIKEKYLRRFTRLKNIFFNSDILFIFAARSENFEKEILAFIEKVIKVKGNDNIHLFCINGFLENVDNKYITHVKLPYIHDENWYYDKTTYKESIYNCLKEYFSSIEW